MWSRSRGWIRTNIIVFGILALGLAAIFFDTYQVNHNKIAVGQGKDQGLYRMTLDISKSWGEDAHGYKYGMQYDGVVENHSDYDFSEWEVDIEFVEGCYIDSYWNGEITFEDNILHLVPMDYNNIVTAGGSQTFGFVLYGPTVEENVLGTGLYLERHIHVQDTPWFWVIIIAGIIMLAVDITVFVMDLKSRALQKRQQVFKEIIRQSFLTFSNMIDAKDAYTKGHSHRVAIYSRRIAEKMGLDEEAQWDIFHIALLHDIGKIGVPDHILKKAGRLTDEEREEIEKHVTVGGDILKDFTAIRGIESGARYHHERYDGSGYSQGLKGEEIPLYARIIGVADAFDAMSSARCYRPKLPMDYIVEELRKCSGTQFDPEIVPYMLEMIRDGEAPVDTE